MEGQGWVMRCSCWVMGCWSWVMGSKFLVRPRTKKSWCGVTKGFAGATMDQKLASRLLYFWCNPRPKNLGAVLPTTPATTT